MKNIFTHLMTSAVLLCTLGGGLQAQTIRMHAAVPFAWQINGQHLSAGDYEIAKDAASSVLQVRNETSGKAAFLVSIPGNDRNTATRLVFHRYGNQYFLAEVVSSGSNVATMRVSKAEREAMQSERPREMAIVLVDVKSVVN